MNKNPFQAIDQQILRDSSGSNASEQNLFHLCDRIGPRFAGTPSYRAAADFMLQRLQEYPLDKVALEPFDFLAWRRGAAARFRMVAPYAHTFDCYSLPYAAATGAKGIRAAMVDAGRGSPAEMDACGEQVNGRLVMTDGSGAHRSTIYQRCVELGAVGFILAGKQPGSQLQTGTVAFGRQGTLPALAIRYEVAQQIRRLQDDNLEFELFSDGSVGQAKTWNVVGELVGSTWPDEWVLVGGHLDSHDNSPGAFDNAAGAVLVMESARLLAKQRRYLKRSIRFLGFAAEEVGLLGSHYHAETHAVELQKARFMLNCDTVLTGAPRGLGFHECPKFRPYLATLSMEMKTSMVFQNRSACHSDHYPFILQGVPTAGIVGTAAGSTSPAFSHMPGDTPEKISLPDLRDCAAFIAQVLVRAANDHRWPQNRRSPEQIEAWRKRA